MFAFLSKYRKLNWSCLTNWLHLLCYMHVICGHQRIKWKKMYLKFPKYTLQVKKSSICCTKNDWLFDKISKNRF